MGPPIMMAKSTSSVGNPVTGVETDYMNFMTLGLQIGENGSRAFIFHMLKNIDVHKNTSDRNIINACDVKN